MSGSSLRDLIKLYIFPLGRTEYALLALAKLFYALGLNDMGDDCTVKAEFNQATRLLIWELQTAKNYESNPLLSKIEPRIDRTVGAIHRAAKEAIDTIEGEVAEEATRFKLEFFPKGVFEITSQSWPEQARTVAALINKLKDEKWIGTVEKLGAMMYLNQLESLNNQFLEEMENVKKADVTANQIRARKKEGQENLLEVVAKILGLFPRSNEDAVERAKLMAPIIEQNDAIREYYRMRRRVRDLDPDTGEEILNNDPTE